MATTSKALLHCCSTLAPRSRDWNAEFQQVASSDDSTLGMAKRRWELLHQLSEEFQTVCIDLGCRIIDTPENVPELQGFPGHHRVGNILIRVWQEAKQARQYHQGFVSALLAREGHGGFPLHVPMSSYFSYKGTPITGQALFPLEKDVELTYRGDGIPDDKVHADIHAAVRTMCDVHNIKGLRPEENQMKYQGIEVLKSPDGRYYVSDAKGLTVNLPRIGDGNSIMRMEAQHKATSRIDRDDQQVNTEAIEVAVEQCAQFFVNMPLKDGAGAGSVGSVSEENAEQRSVCATLKRFGLGKSSAGSVILALEKDATTSQAAQLAIQRLGVEVMCRVAKANLYLEIRGKRLAGDAEALERLLTKSLGWMFDDDMAKFGSRIVHPALKKFGINTDAKNTIKDRLLETRVVRRQTIIRRLCDMIGASVHGSGKKTKTTWTAVSKRPLVDHSTHPHELSATKLESIGSCISSRFVAHVQPLKARTLMWDYEFEDVDVVLKQQVAHYVEQFNEGAPQVLRAKLALAMFYYSVNPPREEEAGQLVNDFIIGFENMKCNTAVAVTHMRLAELFLRTKRVSDAETHFMRAQEVYTELVTALHGGEALLWPYNGLLRCKLMDPRIKTQIVNLVDPVEAIAERSFARSFAFQLVSDIGGQLLNQQLFEKSAKMLMLAVTIAKKAFGGGSEKAANALTDAAFCYFTWDRRRHAEQCESLMKEASEITVEVFGESSLEYAVSLNNYGTFCMQLDQLIKALKVLQQANRIFEDVAEANDPNHKACKKNLAILRNRLRVRAIFLIQRCFRRHRRRRQQRLEAERRSADLITSSEFQERAAVTNEESGAFSVLLSLHTERVLELNDKSIEAAIAAKNLQDMKDLIGEEDTTRQIIESKDDTFWDKITRDRDIVKDEEEDKKEQQFRLMRDAQHLEDEERRARATIGSNEVSEWVGLMDECAASRRVLGFEVECLRIQYDEEHKRPAIATMEEDAWNVLTAASRASEDHVKSKEEARKKREVEQEATEEEHRQERVALESMAESMMGAEMLNELLEVFQSLSIEEERQREDILEDETNVINGKMRRSKAKGILAAVSRGFLARKQLSRHHHPWAAAVVNAHLQSILSSLIRDYKRRVWETRNANVTAIQLHVRAAISQRSMICKKAKVVLRVCKGYLARKNCHVRAVKERKAKQRKLFKKTVQDEVNAREGVFREEQTARHALNKTHLALKEKLRQSREQQRQAAEARVAWATKLKIVQEEEVRHRNTIADDALFDWSQLLRSERKVRALRKKRATPQLESTALVEVPESTAIATQTEPDESLKLPKLVAVRQQTPKKTARRTPVSRPSTREALKTGARSLTASADPFKHTNTLIPAANQDGESSALVVVDDGDPDDPEAHDIPVEYAGYPVDEVIQFALEYERDLLTLREQLLERGDMLEQKLEVAREAREKASMEFLTVGGKAPTAWIPKQPDTPMQLSRQSQLVGTMRSPAIGNSSNPHRAHSLPGTVPRQPSSSSSLYNRRRPDWNTSDKVEKLPAVDKLRSVVDEFTVGWERNAKVQHVGDMKGYLVPATRSAPGSRCPPEGYVGGRQKLRRTNSQRR